MPRSKAPAWTSQEIAILCDVFPAEGVNGAADALPDRSWQAINVMASKLQLKSPIVGNAPEPKLQGARLEEAIRLREVEGWSFARIGATFGVCESAASNAILIALCPRKGFTPAQRDEHGHLLPEGLDRLRLALRRGIKGVDIQLRLGVSAACVAEQRRRYRAELKQNGKMPLPAAGAGEAYSGRKISADLRKEVEQLLLEGYGAATVSTRTGVSNTHVGRARNRLIKRLARKGQCLPGCDIKGVRHKQIASARFITPETVAALKAKLLDRIPVRRAALELAVGLCSAYRIRDDLARELAAVGEQLPKPILPGRDRNAVLESRRANWLPEGVRWIYRYRALCVDHSAEDARTMVLAEHREEIRAEAAKVAAERARPRTFEEQLARVAAGAKIISKVDVRRADPEFTLGGIATGAL